MHGLSKYYHYQEIPLGNIGNGFDELNFNRYKVYKRNNNIFYAKELL